MQKGKQVTDKRSLLIAAIVNKDSERLKQLSSDGKKVVVLNSFLDLLIWGSNGGMKDESITFVHTDQFEQMMNHFAAPKEASH